MGRRYTPTGPLALAPQAFGLLMSAPVSLEVLRRDGVSIVPVRGPLSQHKDPFCDNYEAIRERLSDALDPKPKAVLLQIDSPGGVVAGVFETAKQMRAACDAAGVPLIAYVEGQATSAGYALACVADTIVVSSTGMVGSIGVINALVDATGADAAAGLRFTLITSGARKADTNPHSTTTDDAIQNAQAIVSGMADVFFEHVSAYRPVDVSTLAALQAGVYFGNGAVALGLADGVGTLDDAIAMAAVARTEAILSPQSIEVTDMGTPMEDARAALQSAAESDDEETAKKAKALLAAMDEDEKPDAEEDSPEEEESKAEEDAPEEEESKALTASIEARLLAAEKRALLAARPGASSALVAAVEAAPSLAAASLILDAVPVKSPVVPDVAPAATRGADQGDRSNNGLTYASPLAAEMDRRFGLDRTKENSGVSRSPFGVSFSVVKGAK